MKDNEKLIGELSAKAIANSQVDSTLYAKYDVKRGLRDLNGKGVLAGLTQVGEVQGYTETADKTVPGPGRLIYRGIDIADIVQGFMKEGRNGFEETCYLLLFGEQPSKAELAQFEELLSDSRALSHHFVHDSILTLSSRDIMNAMAQSVLAMYVLDKKADAIDIQTYCVRACCSSPRFPCSRPTATAPMFTVTANRA